MFIYHFIEKFFYYIQQWFPTPKWTERRGLHLVLSTPTRHSWRILQDADIGDANIARKWIGPHDSLDRSSWGKFGKCVTREGTTTKGYLVLWIRSRRNSQLWLRGRVGATSPVMLCIRCIVLSFSQRPTLFELVSSSDTFIAANYFFFFRSSHRHITWHNIETRPLPTMLSTWTPLILFYSQHTNKIASKPFFDLKA